MPVWHGMSRASSMSTTPSSKSVLIAPGSPRARSSRSTGDDDVLRVILVGRQSYRPALTRSGVLGDERDVAALRAQVQRTGEDA